MFVRTKFLIIILVMGLFTSKIYIFAQFSQNYLLTMISLLIFSIVAALSLSFLKYMCYKSDQLVLLILLIIISMPLAVKLILIVMNFDKFVMANGDLLDMAKIIRRITDTAHYPFGEREIRANYIEYPLTFVLQSILSIVLDADVKSIILHSPSSWASYFLVLLTSLLLLRKAVNDDTTLVVASFLMFNFITFDLPQYFVYSNIIRALILIFTYVITRQMSASSYRMEMIVVILLSLAIAIGHVQESLMLLLYLFAFLVVLASHRRLNGKNLYYISSRFAQITILYIVIYMISNLFYATTTYQGVSNFLLKLILRIFHGITTRGVEEKLAIASSALSPYEIILLVLGLIFSAIAIAAVLIRYMVFSFKNRSSLLLAAVLSSGVLSVYMFIPIVFEGIFSDLIFRPLWILLCSQMVVLLLGTQNVNKKTNYCQHTVQGGMKWYRLFIGATIALFIIANILYLRLQLIASNIYLHELSTVNKLSITLNSLPSIHFIQPHHLLVIDTPKFPSYEIVRSLLLIYNTVNYSGYIYIDPDTTFYSYSYLNGLVKVRAINTKPFKYLDTVYINGCKYLFLSHNALKGIYYVLGNTPFCLLRNFRTIVSIGDITLSISEASKQ